MRVLLDEQLPHRLRHLFAPEVEAVTVAYLGWKGKRNGDLLRAAQQEGFDALLTVDRGIPHEQNLRDLQIAIIVLEASGSRYADLEPLMEEVNEALAQLRPGDLVRIGTHRH